MATEAEVPMSIISGLLSLREKGEEYLRGFYKPVNRRGIQIVIEKKKPRKSKSICFGVPGQQRGF